MKRVVTTRGGHVETAHPVTIVICRSDSSVVTVHGPPLVTTWRSAAKPFQLLASLEWLGTADFSDGFLAIGAASHSGESRHVRTVKALLDVLEIPETALRCGAHAPLEAVTNRAMIRAGKEPCSIHNNCSGKHAFMAGALRAYGLKGQDYRRLDHPFQRHVRQVIERYTGGLDIEPGTDGCGVPCWILPVKRMAHAWAQLAQSVAQFEGPLGAIGTAMRRCPELVSGSGRLDLAIAEASGGAVISKVGAAGLLCAAIPDLGFGIAIKVHSGHAQARAVAAASVLMELLPDRFDYRHSWFSEQAIVRNVVGDIIGRVHVE